MCHSLEAQDLITYFNVADHSIKIISPHELDLNQLLPSFAEFRGRHTSKRATMMVEIVTSPAQESGGEYKLLSDLSVIMDERFRFEENADEYRTTIISKGVVGKWEMVSNKDFSISKVYIPSQDNYSGARLSWLIMIAFGQAVLPYRTMLLHASVIRLNEVGIAFLGKSGTGKSTHSRLWLSYVDGCELLNDDNPVLRLRDDGQVYIYGSPWSGKTPCYKSTGVRLTKAIRLEQASVNEYKSLSGKEALLALMPSGSAIRWSPELFNYMLTTLQQVITKVGIGRLKCRPDKNAALLCFREVFQ